MTALGDSMYAQWRLALVVVLTLVAGVLLALLAYMAIGRFGDLISLYFEAWVLQFLLAPAVDWLSRHRWPRGLAAGVVYLCALVLAAAVLVWIVPLFINPLQDLAEHLLGKLSALDIPSLEAHLRALIHRDAPRSLRGPLDAMVVQGASQLQGVSGNLAKDLLTFAQAVTASTISSTYDLVGRVLSLLLSLLTMLILSFFMMTMGRPFVRKARSYLPRSLDPDLDAVRDVINRAFSGFVRGQLILSTIYGVAVAAILLAFSLAPGSGSQLVQFAALAGILGGLIMIVPAVGSIISMFPPMLVGSLALPDWPHRIALIVVIWALNVVVTDMLGPRVMSNSVGINPILSFGALIAGAKVGGILGAFFAAPILAVVLAVLERIYLHMAEHAVPDVATASVSPEPRDEPSPGG